MSTEALLAILGLVFAFVALLPEERRREILVRLLRFDRVLILATIVALHLIKYYPLLYDNDLVPYTGPWRFGLDSESASYLLLLAVTIIVVLRVWLRPLAASRLSTLHSLIETQLRTGQHGPLAALLQRHWDRLVKLHRPDGTWGARMFQRLDARPGVRIVVNGKTEIRPDIPRVKRVRRARARMARLFAGVEQRSERIDDIFTLALRSDEFVSHLAATELPLALRILAYPTRERDAFQERLFEALLSDPRSAFYQELRHNTNLRGSARYALPSQHRLLRHYLVDPRVAEELAVYRPIGEYALQWLADRQRLVEDPYNFAWSDRFNDVEAWRSPIHAAIHFFDIMVLEALHLNVPWHMWLYYFPDFTKSIVSNIQYLKGVDESREWPTPYHFLLYKLFSAMRSWVKEAARLSDTDPSYGVVDVDLEHDNSSIPKSAILAIGACMRHVLGSDKISGRYKSYIVGSILRDLGSMRRHRNAIALVETLALSLRRGGYLSVDFGSASYETRLREAIAGVDWVLCHWVVEEPGCSPLHSMVKEAHNLPDGEARHAEE